MALHHQGDPRYPIGKFSFPQQVTARERLQWIDDIAAAPANLRAAVAGMSDAQLDTPYREGGWTVRQVVHHVPDSHLNSYVRFKLALTENEPVIKPYDEALWAELADTAATPIETSLTMMEALHDRWGRLLRSMDDAAFARTFRHPELGLVRLGPERGVIRLARETSRRADSDREGLDSIDSGLSIYPANALHPVAPQVTFLETRTEARQYGARFRAMQMSGPCAAMNI